VIIISSCYAGGRHGPSHHPTRIRKINKSLFHKLLFIL
jgi:hypothetical protein